MKPLVLACNGRTHTHTCTYTHTRTDSHTDEFSISMTRCCKCVCVCGCTSAPSSTVYKRAHTHTHAHELTASVSDCTNTCILLLSRRLYRMLGRGLPVLSCSDRDRHQRIDMLAICRSLARAVRMVLVIIRPHLCRLREGNNTQQVSLASDVGPHTYEAASLPCCVCATYLSQLVMTQCHLPGPKPAYDARQSEARKGLRVVWRAGCGCRDSGLSSAVLTPSG